ncbi:hypothetical protein P280DRAFT_504062 [Massarina eburnea CBS 473.64]|uniref:CENP-V/GFA domain-containing protein n=1 Tax=Massarina eburnea CBS 473.64 TaxID=1395130 RepID=A0A6A6S9D0_9PLEO|nr:hypothetical protein P280DRAFT_504062 [Massarina eburnea CBS 473.64]
MATSKPTYKKEWTGDPKTHDPSSFEKEITGTCLCGAISVTVHDNIWASPQKGHLCHCQNCRKASGSFISSNMVMEKAKVTLTDPQSKMKIYEDYDTGSGKVVKRCFCSDCGNPIMSQPAIFPTIWILKMGMFPRIPKPEAESFVGHRQSWEDAREGGLENVVLFETVRGEKKFGDK